MSGNAGYPPAVNVGRSAPVARPGESQFRVNFGEALREANPVVNTVLAVREGRPIREALAMQLPRFMLTPGKAPEMVERYPKIVALAQANAYAGHIAGKARKLAGKECTRFLEESLKGLKPEQHELVLRALRRRGIKP